MICCIVFLIHEFSFWEIMMSAITSQITSRTIVYSTVYSGADQRKHQSSASLVFLRGIHRWPVNSPHRWPVTRKIFSFDDVIMACVINIRVFGSVGIHSETQTIDFELNWRHWTYNMLVRYILSRLSIFSQLSIILYIGLVFQFAHFPFDDWENIHFVLSSSSSNRKYELLSIV